MKMLNLLEKIKQRKLLFMLFLILAACFVWSTRTTPAAQAASDRVATVPILLYHGIPNNSPASDRYNVSLAKFEEQMKLLKDYGYKTISIQQLANHLNKGYVLPERPIVISFDDGYQNVYDNAFPIMARYGFTGTVYIVANRLQSDGFMNKKVLQALVENGWEVGSHGMTHTELTQNHNLVRTEILQSRLDLNDALDIKVFSFAYPFGSSDWYITSKVLDYGYFAAVGVGNLDQHSSGTVYNLSRREVMGDATWHDFEALLPWTGRYVPPRRKYTPL
jgi:peptidoglycan/xylan/chitin deacetylase (PgdA/CDA1 family)